MWLSLLGQEVLKWQQACASGIGVSLLGTEAEVSPEAVPGAGRASRLTEGWQQRCGLAAQTLQGTWPVSTFIVFALLTNI
ncbi:rCG56515 [Rattus norvegicus]|uniref:RCG56515 n=1 Tax=Rattus norvegicus TaxID=10116 RepID=A6IB47_RAT|nr:rCG56515 [Rattus norvegicus]